MKQSEVGESSILKKFCRKEGKRNGVRRRVGKMASDCSPVMRAFLGEMEALDSNPSLRTVYEFSLDLH